MQKSSIFVNSVLDMRKAKPQALVIVALKI